MQQPLALISSSNQVALRTTLPLNENPSSFAVTDVINTSGGFARMSLQKVNQVTDACFHVAKASTSFGFGIGKTLLSGVGLSTFPLEAAEFLALTGIEIGQGATSLSLKGSSEIVRVMQELFGDSFSMELVRTVIDMTEIEIKKTGRKIGMVELWNYFTAWVSLQKLTKEDWRKDFIFPNVEEIPSNPKKPNMWKVLSRPFKKSNFPKTSLGFPNDTVTLLPLLKHFVKFANGCYGELSLQYLKENNVYRVPIAKHSSDLHFYSNYCGIPIDDIIYMSSLETKNELFNSNYQPRYVLSVDHSHSTIVLAFRGTMSPRDVVVDLAGEIIKLSIGDDPTMYSLHGGMLKVVAKVSDPSHSSGIFRRTRDLLEKYPDYSLTLTGMWPLTLGHSLGAGLASILSLLWADPDTGRTRPESGLGDHEVKVYAFACPSTMDIRLSERTEGVILTTVIGWDWLARVSHTSVLEIRDAAIKLKEIEVDQPGILECIISGQCTAEDKAKLFALRHQITQEHIPRENDYEKLHPPGRIAWIYKSMENPEKYAFYHVKDRSKVFGEILFDDDMMKSHHPPSYDDILFRM